MPRDDSPKVKTIYVAKTFSFLHFFNVFSLNRFYILTYSRFLYMSHTVLFSVSFSVNVHFAYTTWKKRFSLSFFVGSRLCGARGKPKRVYSHLFEFLSVVYLNNNNNKRKTNPSEEKWVKQQILHLLISHAKRTLLF